MQRVKPFFLILLLALVAGCAGRDIRSYEGETPRFRPEEFFDGHVKAWGFSESRFGGISQEFEADFRGGVDGDTLTMHETLRYEDGRTKERTWTIRRVNNHRYSIHASDMVGTGTGRAYGNAVHWNYQLPVGRTGWTMHFDDRMVLRNRQTMVDRVVVSRYGITLGYGYVFFRRVKN